MSDRRILVVDDEPSIRLVLRRALEASGYQVDEAADGERGIAALESASYDLVITDIFMPHEDGLGLLRHVRAEHPGLQTIVISAPCSAQSFDLAERMGAARVFPKPISLRELVAAVDELLGE